MLDIYFHYDEYTFIILLSRFLILSALFDIFIIFKRLLIFRLPTRLRQASLSSMSLLSTLPRWPNSSFLLTYFCLYERKPLDFHIFLACAPMGSRRIRWPPRRCRESGDFSRISLYRGHISRRHLVRAWVHTLLVVAHGWLPGLPHSFLAADGAKSIAAYASSIL